MGAVLSLGREERWRRFLVSKVNAIPGSWVLDAASGTGLVARRLAAGRSVRVASLDSSEQMLRAGLEVDRLAGLDRQIAPVLGRAERLPFGDETFDSVTFTYLLRYVPDPKATVAELARVLRPRGVIAALEFSVPRDPLARVGWWAYTRAVMPILGRVVSPEWYRTGRFLGPNISSFYERYPLPAQIRWWQEAGIRHLRTRTMLQGTAIVTWGVKGGYASDD